MISLQEEIDSGSGTPSSASLVREPVKGHVSSIRTQPKKPDIVTTLKDASKKHFDPRTGALQEGPSAMGVTQQQLDNNSSTPSLSVISNTNDSLRGSLVTLGSRNDLLDSQKSDLNSLGETEQLRLPLVKARFDVPLNNNVSSHNQSSSYYESLDLGVPGKSSASSRPKAYQRTRSDTTKLSLANKQLATSAYNIINNNNLSSTKINNTNNPAAFQSLADINKLPSTRINNTFKSQSQVKDSGYGSYDHVGIGRNAEPADLGRRTSNGALQKMTTQTSSSNNYMSRDTAYDRVKFTNSNSRRRNYMK